MKEITQKTGDAPIKQQGHTTSGTFGSNLHDEPRYKGTVSDLKIK